MSPDVQSAFNLLVSAAQQAHLTAPEHVAVQNAAAKVEAALQPKDAIPPAAKPEPVA